VQLGVARGVQVQLELGDLLDAVGGAFDDALDLGGDLGGTRPRGAQLGRDRLQPRDLLAYVEQQGLAQQQRLVGEVVRQRAQRDARGGGDRAIGDLADAVLAAWCAGAARGYPALWWWCSPSSPSGPRRSRRP
jgi:hypothetical protein